jgi:antitoxin FitA
VQEHANLFWPLIDALGRDRILQPKIGVGLRGFILGNFMHDSRRQSCSHSVLMLSFCYQNDGVSSMAAITVRNLPEETARALKARAAHSGRSTEAEVREILNAAVRTPVGLGTALAALGKRVGGVDLSRSRKRSQARAASFES